MKAGDLIGIGSDRCVGLFCEVREVRNGKVGAWVINGAWHATVLPNKAVEVRTDVRKPLMHTMPGEILFAGRIPEGQDDYNKAIAYMNDYLQRNVVARLWVDVMNFSSVQAKRFRRSCAAFKRAWNGKPVAVDNAEFDDSIPF